MRIIAMITLCQLSQKTNVPVISRGGARTYKPPTVTTPAQRAVRHAANTANKCSVTARLLLIAYPVGKVQWDAAELRKIVAPSNLLLRASPRQVS